MDTSSIQHDVLLLILASIVCISVIFKFSGLGSDTSKRRFNLGRFFGKPSNLADSQDDSEILAFYTQGHTLACADRGIAGDMSYATYATIANGDGPTPFGDELALIHVLDLPFNTNTHLVGLTKQHRIDRVMFGNFVKANGMEPVVLESDFRDYFDLYAAKDQDIEAREIMNPKSMAFVVDYCKTHFWEINRSELYIVASNTDKAGGGNMFAEAQQFVAQIKPALRAGDPGAPVVHHELPYGEYEGPALKCPICSKDMTSNKLWHTCPDGHGILIAGRELMGLKNHQITIDADPSNSQPHGQLTCPNCQNAMEEIDFDEDKNLKIETCTNCPFRWLDAEEVVRISTRDENSQNKLKDILGAPDPVDTMRRNNDV